VTPLEVLLLAMREAYKKRGIRAAQPYAKDAAPYMHPRLSAIAAKVNQPGDPWAEILNLIDGRSRGLPNQQRTKAGNG
jgi:hypothetical protein